MDTAGYNVKKSTSNKTLWTEKLVFCSLNQLDTM
jgi:hypothetical protein